MTTDRNPDAEGALRARLQELSSILTTMSQEVARTRRLARQLRQENVALRRRVAGLERQPPRTA